MTDSFEHHLRAERKGQQPVQHAEAVLQVVRQRRPGRAAAKPDGQPQAAEARTEEGPRVHRLVRTAPQRAARPPLVTMAPPQPAANTPLPLPAAMADILL